jgi:hypothetical protein
MLSITPLRFGFLSSLRFCQCVREFFETLR